MAGEALFAEDDLRNRCGPGIDRILDDEGEGEATESAVDLVIEDSTAAVWSYLPDDYELPPVDPNDPFYGSAGTKHRVKERPNLRRLALDYAFAELCIRHPEFQRDRDGVELKKLAVSAIKDYGMTLRLSDDGSGDGSSPGRSGTARVFSYGRPREW